MNFVGDIRMSKPLVTVFTSTYNRRHTLERVYNSLCSQTVKNFEWVVIDDGSSDGTEALIENLKSVAPFDIVYVWKENGGKHTSYNLLPEVAKSDLFFSLDSDDAITTNCLQVLIDKYHEAQFTYGKSYAGVMCLARDEHGQIMGDLFTDDDHGKDVVRVLLNHKKLGDKGCLCTIDLLREFPFPAEVTRVYVPESIHIHAYSKKYKMLYVNQDLLLGWKSEGGDHLTDVMQKKSNLPGAIYGLLAWPSYSMRYFFVRPKLYIAVVTKYVAVANALGWPIRKQFAMIQSIPGKLLCFICYPIGLLRLALNR